MTVSVILLAGGIGSRMGGNIPKQFLFLHGKPVILHSLEIFMLMPEVREVVVVCEEKYRSFFNGYSALFAAPGPRRQDSLFEGLKVSSPFSEYVCVHDAARPFINQEMVERLFEEGKKIGAAALGMPVKWTVKEAESGFVKCTLDREKVWEIQTPQFLKKSILEKGFKQAYSQGITVTDDVSLAELIGHPVKLVNGSYQNLKLTTPEDLLVASCINTK